MKRQSRLKEEVINGRAKKEPKGYEKKGTPSSERLSSGSRIIREDPRRTKTPKKKGSLRSEPEADLWKVSFWTRTPLRYTRARGQWSLETPGSSKGIFNGEYEGRNTPEIRRSVGASNLGALQLIHSPAHRRKPGPP